MRPSRPANRRRPASTTRRPRRPGARSRAQAPCRPLSSAGRASRLARPAIFALTPEGEGTCGAHRRGAAARHRSRATRTRGGASTVGGMDATIETRGLTKRYGRTVAVDDLSIAVRPGRVTGFVGPNGAGKTTTMQLLLGLAAADSRRGARRREALRGDRPAADRRRRAARRGRGPSEPLGAKPPALARPEQRHPEAARRRGARARRALERPPAAGGRVLARDEAASRRRRGAARRSADPDPRRADDRARSGGDPVDARDAARARSRGPHGVRVEPPDERARGHRRPPDRDRPRAAARRRLGRRADRDGVGRPRRDHHARRAGRDDRPRERRRHRGLERPRPGRGQGIAAGRVSELLAEHRVPLEELAASRATLEEAYFRLTRDAGEHVAVPFAASGRPNDRTLRSEWTKLRTQRGTLIALLAMCVLMVAMTALAASEQETNAVFGGDDDVVQIGLSGVVFAELAAIVVGASLITAEYATGMIRTTLTATQSRLRVLVAKAVVLARRDVPAGAGRVGGRVRDRAGAAARPRLRRAGVPAGLDHRPRRGAGGGRHGAPADRLRAHRARHRHRAAALGRRDRGERGRRLPPAARTRRVPRARPDAHRAAHAARGDGDPVDDRPDAGDVRRRGGDADRAVGGARRRLRVGARSPGRRLRALGAHA